MKTGFQNCIVLIGQRIIPDIENGQSSVWFILGSLKRPICNSGLNWVVLIVDRIDVFYFHGFHKCHLNNIKMNSE